MHLVMLVRSGCVERRRGTAKYGWGKARTSKLGRLDTEAIRKSSLFRQVRFKPVDSLQHGQGTFREEHDAGRGGDVLKLA